MKITVRLVILPSRREYYLTGPADTPDQAAWRTEIGWPIFDTSPPAGEAQS